MGGSHTNRTLGHILSLVTSGIKRWARLDWAQEKLLLRQVALAPVAAMPAPKQHSFKYELPALPSYEPSEVPEEFWRHWWKRPLSSAVLENASWIDPEKLLSAAVGRGMAEDGRLQRVCKVLRDGANLGCTGRGRLPTSSANSDSVWQADVGPVIADVLQDWVIKGVAAGPVTKRELQEVFGHSYTVNKMTTRPKPNGALRIIVDMSSPRDRDPTVPGWLWRTTLPGAVNSSIDITQFPARMSSLRIFVRMLYSVGRGALVFKIDWSDAYKHIKVRKEDLKLQVIEFGGRFFVELRLVFGARSSPGIYDEVSDVILDMAVLESEIIRTRVTKHLDDTLGVGRNTPDDPVHACFKAYLKVAQEVGVKLPAPDVDKSKVQSPATSVLALGMEFDTVEWTVKCPELKVARILHLVRKGLAEGVLLAGELASLSGMLVDKIFLLEGARFNIGEITKLVVMDVPVDAEVGLSDVAREQLRWWFLNIQRAAFVNPIRHPEQKIWSPAGSPEAFTDAAGGSLVNIKAGLGVVLPTGDWAYFPWPHWIQSGGLASTGAPVNSQLMYLELCGPLVGLAVGASRWMNGPVVFRIDNQSGVYTWRKGYSSKDPLSSTVVKAIFDLGRHLNCSVYIAKVARCSTRGAVAADCLSKGEFGEFFRVSPASPVDPLRIPSTLVRWLSWPIVDLSLGTKIATELRARGVDTLE